VIEQRFGTLPIAALLKPGARGLFKTWRDQIASAPPQDARQRAELKKAGKTAPIAGDRQADYAWGVLARVLSVAKDRGTIPTNPCERGGKLYEVDRAEVIWLPAAYQGVRRSGSGRTAVCPGARAMDRPAARRSNQAHLVAV
jgi:hypothetical protein